MYYIYLYIGISHPKSNTLNMHATKSYSILQDNKLCRKYELLLLFNMILYFTIKYI